MDMLHPHSPRFWTKVRDKASRLPFMTELVAMYYCALDPATPLRAKGILLGALAYFVLPFDIVPDFMIGLGYTDDLAALLAAWRAIRPYITDKHRLRARHRLDRPQP